MFLIEQNGGQAVVEYMLVVAIAVSIIIALKGTFKKFGDFTHNYLGAYTTCLMEYGELPSLGISDADFKTHLSDGKTCNTQFGSFSLASGRPPLSSSSTNSANNKNSQGGNSNSAANEAGGSGSANRNADSKKNSDNPRFSSSSSPYSSGMMSRSGGKGTADGASSVAGKTKIIEDESLEEGGDTGRGRGRQTRTIYRQRQRYKAVTGKMAEEFNKSANRADKRAPASKTIAKNEDGNGIRPRTNLVKVPESSMKITEQKADEGWTFGNFLKWIMIIGIIIAIVIFFGGQILNYSNSDS